MTSNDYSEDKLIQKSTAELLEHELGWESVFAFDKEVLGENGTLGRMGQHEVLLRPRFKVALKRLNPWLTDKQMEEALLAMTEHMSSASLMQTNEEKYRYIRDGIPVTCYKPNGEKDERRALVIDFREGHQEENDFLAVRELTVRGALYERRADLVCFVNGLPLVFMEVKNHDIAVENAYNDNYSDYLVSISQLFYYNAFSILSNGIDARIGTIGSKWEFFNHWKRLVEEEAGNIELPTMLRGVLNKKNLLDLVENFILYDHSDGKNVKILARNHQYLGVNQAVEMYRHRKELQKKSKHVDVTDISVVINHIINDHLDIDENGVDSSHEDHPIIDISKINFDILRREFAKSKRKNLVMRDLQDMLQERLARMMAVNSNL